MGSTYFKGRYCLIHRRVFWRQESQFLIVIELTIDFFLIKQLCTAHKVPILWFNRLVFRKPFFLNPILYTMKMPGFLDEL